ncbi:uncharacterized protein PSANT_07050 [Moesziomyces antarcticus]|uniref:Kinetochore protein mis13 n=1 Tax=Pseudozyma antarctica TaxID=84753 RepID=A0A5C3G0M6_PSEA2|nr:uncharacterized protein PSANT_07050 [Moesziomyces antarcticus]
MPATAPELVQTQNLRLLHRRYLFLHSIISRILWRDSTVAARNAAKQKTDRKERRFEDVMDSSFAADDTRRMDMSMGAFQPIKSSTSKRSREEVDAAARKVKQASSRRDEPPKAKRKLRQTLGEESDDDFVFSREPARRNAPPLHPHQQLWVVPPPVLSFSRNGASPSAPVSKSNLAAPTGREAAEQSRRSSLNLKGQRRVSSLRDGTAAYPHEDVPDHELFRHCSDQLPPVVRMKHLVGWILKRSLDIARGKAELPVRSRDAAKKAKGKAKEADELPIGEFDSVLQQLLTDLNDGVFGISWMGATDEKEGKRQTPHPRNESNRKASAQLSAIVEAMRNESLAWSKELTRLEDYEAETSRLEALVDDEGAAESGDVIAWDRHDLDEAGLQQLRDAEAAMEWLQKLEAEDAADAPKAKSRTKGRASRAAQARGADDDNEQLQGTEHDPRWADVEFNVDLLRSRSHQFAQLESLASRYVRTVSAHAAQALRDRTSSSSALAGTSSSSAKRGRRKAATDTNDGGHGSSERLEALLSGVRESRSISTTGAESRPSAPDQSVADVSASTFVEPDESETTDLLRALARM